MSKHDIRKDGSPFKSDLARNPGIGQSKGSFATGEDPEELEGDSTIEGDVENDAEPSGRVDPKRLGRSNK
jgi:hypothetical protein